MNDEQTAEPKEKEQIWIVGPVAGDARTVRKRDIVARPAEVLQVRENFGRFLQSLKAIVDVEVPTVGQFELDEVQFSAEISANGEFKLMGTGAGLEATSGVTFTLRRKQPAQP